MSLIESIQSVFAGYFDFGGRARRSEFWWYMLVYSIINSILGIFVRPALLDRDVLSIIVIVLAVIIELLLLIPTLALLFRRLHDTGKKAWWLLLYLTCIGGIVLFIFFVMDSQPGTNRYGHNPKGM